LVIRINQQIQRNNPKPATNLLKFCKCLLYLILNFHLVHRKRTIRKRPLTFWITQIRPQNMLRISNISTQLINCKIFYLSFGSHIKNKQCNVNKNLTDATLCKYLFPAKLLYMFRVSQHPSSGVLKTVPAASGTSSMTCTGGCEYSF